MKKIYVNKTDSVTAVIEKVIKSSDVEIILYVPKGSELASTKNNFVLLKRDADSAKKLVSIESTDKEAIALAEASGMKGIDPLLGRSKKTVSDIISPVETSSPRPEPKIKPLKSEPPSEESRASLSSAVPPRESKKPGIPVLVSKPGETGIVPLESEARPSLRRRLLLPVLGLGTLAIAILLVFYILPSAEIALAFQKVPLDFQGSLTVGSSEKEASISGDEVKIPGEKFLQKKNATMSLGASGKKLIQRKATGKITIYNAFSSKTQSLVKDTRFSTPDGKIFRLNNSVTIPGAEIADSRIVPASIEATVTADKPGEEYNVGPVSRFRIPGFQGTPKYDGFYGESKEAMSGGFVGEMKVPTDEDVAKAKAQIRTSLEEALQAEININFPADIKILEGASQFLVTKEEIDDVADNDGNFKITADAEMTILGFREADLVSVFASKLSADSGVKLELDTREIEYGRPRADFVSGSFGTALKIKSTWRREFDSSAFKKSILGKNESELKAAALGLQGIKSGSVKLWPFWVKSAPSNEGKIKIDVTHEL